MKKKMIFLILFFIFIILAVGIWAFFIEPNLIRVEKISLKIKNLPSSFENVKIVHLTDFHSKKFGRKEKKVLKILNQLNPDFVFITGDIIDRTTRDFESLQRFWKELSKNYQGSGVQPSLKAKLPPRIFGVYGNHEHRNPKFKIFDKLFKENKIAILNNDLTKLERDGNFIYLIGVDDPHLGYDNIEKAMQGIDEEAPKILLAHSPEIFRKVRDKNIDLVLVGHTHGCQVNIPFVCDFILPLKYDKKYKRGLFKEDSTYMYVSRGIGETILPIRFNAFPEITLIKLISND